MKQLIEEVSAMLTFPIHIVVNSEPLLLLLQAQKHDKVLRRSPSAPLRLNNTEQFYPVYPDTVSNSVSST